MTLNSQRQSFKVIAYRSQQANTSTCNEHQTCMRTKDENTAAAARTESQYYARRLRNWCCCPCFHHWTSQQAEILRVCNNCMVSPHCTASARVCRMEQAIILVSQPKLCIGTALSITAESVQPTKQHAHGLRWSCLLVPCWSAEIFKKAQRRF